MAMKHIMSAGEFKNTCLKVMDQVCESGLEIVVTKRGRPVVRIVPAWDPEPHDGLEGMILHQDPDLFSTGEKWEADE
jgi:prevent-host-death family protein